MSGSDWLQEESEAPRGFEGEFRALSGASRAAGAAGWIVSGEEGRAVPGLQGQTADGCS